MMRIQPWSKLHQTSWSAIIPIFAERERSERYTY
jgi:hypothetical protein